jgi:phenylacetic acid degradation operon negative regulatory protein
MPGFAQHRRGDSVRLVPFLFGLAESEELPGPALVRLLADLGMTQGAARTLLTRMRQNGQISAQRNGRPFRYRLDGQFLGAFRRIRDDRSAAQAAEWDGSFHAVLYQVAEPERAFRDRLRRMATFAGYGLLQQGVLVCPTDRRAALAGVLAGQPADSVVHFARLELDRSAAAQVAYQAWDLGALAAHYREQAALLRAALPSQPLPPDATTLRRYAERISLVLVDLLRAPALPPDLFPPDWPLPELRAALTQTQAMYVPPSRAYVQSVLANTRGEA